MAWVYPTFHLSDGDGREGREADLAVNFNCQEGSEAWRVPVFADISSNTRGEGEEGEGDRGLPHREWRERERRSWGGGALRMA